MNTNSKVVTLAVYTFKSYFTPKSKDTEITFCMRKCSVDTGISHGK